MGMQTGKSEEAITEINVTPLVDVCLVLVIIFMAVAPFALQSGIKVLQSRSSVGIGKVSSSENVQIKLTQEGNITINGRQSSFEKLFPDMAYALASSRDKVVIVTAESNNKVRDVVTILDISKQAGASRVAIMKNE